MKPDDRCAFCGHTRDEHEARPVKVSPYIAVRIAEMIGGVGPRKVTHLMVNQCWGEPLAPELDAGGECPCLGFEERERQ